MVVLWWLFVPPSEGDVSRPVVIEQKDNVLMFLSCRVKDTDIIQIIAAMLIICPPKWLISLNLDDKPFYSPKLNFPSSFWSSLWLARAS